MNPDKLNRLTETRQKLGRFLRVISEFLEIALAVVILVGIIIRFVHLPQAFSLLLSGESIDLMGFVDFIVDSVIAIELVHLLCQPNLDSVVEILMVAITREIITMEQDPKGTLIYVLALGLVFVIRRFMFVDKLDRHDGDFSLSSMKEHLLHKKNHEKQTAAKEDSDAEASEKADYMEIQQ